MSSLSSYAVRMARLSAQIFGEVVRPTDAQSLKVVRLFQEQPLAKRKEVHEWYPQHKIYYAMTQKLRFLGLFSRSNDNEAAAGEFYPHTLRLSLRRRREERRRRRKKTN